MTLPRPNRLCRLFGHHWNPEGAHYYCVYHCERCGHEGYEDGSWRERIGVRVWVIQQAIGQWIRSWRYWLRCDDCGRWFGRHDDSQDHLPF